MADITQDIYDLLDKSDLTASTFLQGKKSMTTIVNQVRLKLVSELVKYIEEREQNGGV